MKERCNMPKKWHPDKYQLKGVQWLLQHAAAALFYEMGMGKTSIAYAALSILKKEGLLHGALVIAPLRPAVSVWPAEAAEWDDFKHLDVVVLHGKNKEKLVTEKHDIYIINFEGLQWLINGGYLKNLLSKKWVDTLIVDELSRFKNASRKAIRRKLLIPFLPRFTRRWGLTGSPAANSLMNLFGEINILDLGNAFGIYITHFRAMFFTPVGMWGWRINKGAEEVMYARIKPIALRMAAKGNVKMPEIKYSDITVELPPAARRNYTDMEDDMLTILADDTVSAGSASAVYGKCCQLVGGAVFKSIVNPITGEPLGSKGGAREWHLVHDAKLDELEELIEDLQGQQVLVAYWYRHSLERLQQRFGKDTPYIGSGVSVKKAQAYEAEWNAGNIPVMFGQPASMGHGLNLQHSNAHHIVWFDLIPDYELYTQYNARLCRRGNKAPFVFVHHIAARQTVDTWAILPSLRRKEKTQNKLFDALRLRARGLKLTRNK